MSTTKADLVANYRPDGESDSRVEPEAVRFEFTSDLDEVERGLLAQGFRRIGSSESFSNRNEMGVSHFIREHGSEVGATMVAFAITPGKLRSARPGADGRIDIAALRADPPASLSPRGYYLLQTRYYALLG